jgi:hypothetical protein
MSVLPLQKKKLQRPFTKLVLVSASREKINTQVAACNSDQLRPIIHNLSEMHFYKVGLTLYHKLTDGLGRKAVMEHTTYVPYLALRSFKDNIY